jgi:hypothetical protein
LLGVAARLWLLERSNWLLEGDDALSALMAFDVLEGDRPLMLKNQTYASAWEPYAMAASYALFGISRVSAKLPALLGSLAMIGTTWALARVVAGRTAAWFAALLMALPPVYVLVLGLKPWAPYTEVIVFGTLSLACAVRLAWPDSLAPGGERVRVRGACRPMTRDALRSVGCGLAGGVAFWMHPLGVCYLIAAAIPLLARVRGRRWRAVGPLGVLGFVVGALPFWLFNLQTGGSTFKFVLEGTRGQTADRGEVLSAWWSADLPRGAGLWHPWGPSPPELGWLMALAIVGALAWAIVGRQGPRLRPLDSVLVLLLVIPTVLVFSGFGGPALNPYGFDATGRYTPPIWSALAVVLGAALAAVGQLRPWLAALLALLPLGVNLAGLVAIQPLQAFQSPYWSKLPADNGPLLAALRTEGVTHVWLNHWASQPLMFDARAVGQPLVAYDWYDVQAGGIDRFPEYRPLLERAERPGFVLVTTEEEPELERRLRALGVDYSARRVPPYVLIVPTSRSVHPSEVGSALDYRY